mmetsp:Transcript_22170/g.37885  ORF Transcript_22170/g.37885 Transcript_22170/m.37885 type:complete len:163 (+) Transcript_22170:163-651(+)|eukprot:CAMPEP_0119107628 /NCGR_PEP_ID=MMETSP1180-20130426/11513_1 /TAXON_ID=3052 ORGANISM="Chlamydomonas cf sp, Strain CCMP681" /NCGR_SAMPLE_ID=MMETSP1180 /ASSEMBLY_ACC=CAM_ASM_000741 /LENGTH=162 /DNA_ID=CAMNT_0007093145 /DNA_START=120 /DNA_END=608 /DNA_ORIENTATION=+
MGRPFRLLLNDEKVYACGNCRTHLAAGEQLASKHFHAKSGRAYLFHNTCNTTGGPHEQRMMTTGKHIVCDLYCQECSTCVGWQYVFAFEESQKYKTGMCVLERAIIVDFDKTSGTSRSRRGEHGQSLARTSQQSGGSGSQSSGSEAMVLFAADDPGSDSEDE